MKILAIILARKDSKRCKGKNTRLLGGKPLITWTLDTVKDLNELCDIIVSTDDPIIANFAKTAKVLVPWLRPAYLASDNAKSVDAILHALDWYRN